MMTSQREAQEEFAPTPKKSLTQHQRIIEVIRHRGFITNWGAIYDLTVHCTKLSTRIGEIERKSGIKFRRERQYSGKQFTGYKYSVPEGHTIDEFIV